MHGHQPTARHDRSWTRDVQTEILDNLSAKAKEQRTKPVEVRLRELESVVARLKWEVSAIKSTLKLHDLRVEAARSDASEAVSSKRRKRR